MSLRVRLALVVGVIVAVAVALGAGGAYFVTADSLMNEVDEFLYSRVARFDSSRPNSGIGPRPEGPLVTPDSVTQLLGREGQVLQYVGPVEEPLPTDETDVELATVGGPTRLRTVDHAGTRFRVITVALDRGGALQVGRDLAEVDAVLASLRLRMLLLGLAGTALAAVVGWLVARRITRPVERLTEAAEHVAATQDLSTPIEVRGDAEVGRLATSFNTMLGALETSRQQQRRLVQDASHELRTPLTSLRANVELLARPGALGPDEQREVLADVQAELQELTLLTGELVDLASDQKSAEAPVEVVLAEVANETAQRARRRSGREVVVELDDPAVVNVRRGQLERSVGNLVDNALKFAPGGPVVIRVAGAAVTVMDHGPGIADADRARVFDRFYRADAARTLPGSGLGLAMVQQFADDHGARTTVEEAPGGGAAVGLDLRACRVATPTVSSSAQ